MCWSLRDETSRHGEFYRARDGYPTAIFPHFGGSNPAQVDRHAVVGRLLFGDDCYGGCRPVIPSLQRVKSFSGRCRRLGGSNGSARTTPTGTGGRGGESIARQ